MRAHICAGRETHGRSWVVKLWCCTLYRCHIRVARFCLSVRPSVRPPVRPSVRPSIRPTVRRSRMHRLGPVSADDRSHHRVLTAGSGAGEGSRLCGIISPKCDGLDRGRGGLVQRATLPPILSPNRHLPSFYSSDFGDPWIFHDFPIKIFPSYFWQILKWVYSVYLIGFNFVDPVFFWKASSSFKNLLKLFIIYVIQRSYFLQNITLEKSPFNAKIRIDIPGRYSLHTTDERWRWQWRPWKVSYQSRVEGTTGVILSRKSGEDCDITGI